MSAVKKQKPEQAAPLPEGFKTQKELDAFRAQRARRIGKEWGAFQDMSRRLTASTMAIGKALFEVRERTFPIAKHLPARQRPGWMEWLRDPNNTPWGPHSPHAQKFVQIYEQLKDIPRDTVVPFKVLYLLAQRSVTEEDREAVLEHARELNADGNVISIKEARAIIEEAKRKQNPEFEKLVGKMQDEKDEQYRQKHDDHVKFFLDGCKEFKLILDGTLVATERFAPEHAAFAVRKISEVERMLADLKKALGALTKKEKSNAA